MSDFKIYFPAAENGLEGLGVSLVKRMLQDLSFFVIFGFLEPESDEDEGGFVGGSLSAQAIKDNAFYITDEVIEELLHEYGDDALMSTNFFIKNNLEDLLNYLLTVKYQMPDGYETRLFKDFRLYFCRDRDTSRGYGFSSFDCEIFINKNLPIKRLLQLTFNAVFSVTSDDLFIRERDKKGSKASASANLDKVIVA